MVIVFNLFCYNCSSQGNLVPNGSFEFFTTCPTLGANIHYAAPWFQPNNGASAPSGSSDFYHVCNYPSLFNVPFNVTYQYPKTGNGYAGINLYHDTVPLWKDWDREYIEIGLSDSLKADKKYCVRFYTNKGDISKYAIKNIQAVLTNDSLLYNDPNYGYITGVTPIMEADSVITDTLNWVMIQTTYTANGGEKFLTIGNFSSGTNTVYKYVWPFNGIPSNLGYYLIDDVSIYEQPEIFAGNDTILPLGDSVQLGIAGRPDIFYSWQPVTDLNNPNIANPIAKPGTCITYTLTVTDTNQLACTNVFTDVVKVNVQNCDTTKTGLTIPNVFTPNNDEINDEWVVKNLPAGTHIKIFNRWGIAIGGLEDTISMQGTYKWDGRTTAGIACNDGTYYYVITTSEQTYKGFLQLLKK